MGVDQRLRLIALGAALAYFFDPDNGTERRKAAIKKLAAGRRRRRAEGRLGEARGRAARPQGRGRALRRRRAAKDQIDVNAESGKIVLSGEADSPEMIDELVAKAHKVEGVQEVESLLHAPARPGPRPSSV